MDAAGQAESEGGWEEALALYESAFRRLATKGDAATAAELMRRIGRVHRARGDADLAVEALEAALEIARVNGLEEQRAQVLNSLAVAEQMRGRLDAAESRYVAARDLAEALGDGRLIAMVDQNLATMASIRGDPAAALERYRSALERHRLVGDGANAASALINMGMAHTDLEEWSEAAGSYQEALDIAAGIGDTALVGMVEQNRAELHLRQQRYEDARASCERSLEIFRRLRMRPRTGAVYKLFGVLYRETSKPDLAETHFAMALGVAEVCEDRLLEAETQNEWAQAHLQEGRHRSALRRLNRARRIFSDLRARRELGNVEQRLDSLRAAYPRAAAGWGGAAVEARDHYRVGHAERVAKYGGALAEAVGLRGWDATWIRVGAHLHDIGLTALPHRLLVKPGALTSRERGLLRTHPVVGDAMVAEMEFPAELRAIVRNHHEHWDGGGYPDRLEGERIPLGARILTVADVFTALTAPRRYRPAFGRNEAIRLMEAETGTTLDPDLFEAFRAIV